ncbi:MAG: hypothetical protein RR060_04170 [Victivallaceae bacterium]
MKKTVQALIIAVLACVSAGCSSVSYDGVKFAPVTQEVEIYTPQNIAEAGDCMYIGEITASGPIRDYTRPKLIAKLREKAAEYGAGGMIISVNRVYQEQQTPIPDMTPGIPDTGYTWNRIEDDLNYNYGQIGRESANVPNGPYIREIKALLLRPTADLSAEQQAQLQDIQAKYRQIAAAITPNNQATPSPTPGDSAQ